MGMCDVCSVDLPDSQAARYSADEFRRLVAVGFGPGEDYFRKALAIGVSRTTAKAHWVTSTVEVAATDWALCRDCDARVAQFRQAVATTEGRRAEVQQEAQAKKDYDDGQVISSLPLVISPVAIIMSIMAWRDSDTSTLTAIAITAAAAGLTYWAWAWKLPKKR